MFKFAPKQVEPTIAPKKGRKNKDIAKECFDETLVIIEKVATLVEAGTKPQDITPVEMRKHLRNILREVKEVKKLLNKYKNIQYKPKRTRGANNTGLEKLRPVSENMALFAGWDYGTTQKSRHDVTNVLCAYIKELDLREPDNKTIITPDAKLKELLQLEDDVVLKYPTMQKYLKNCFEEVEEPEVVVEDPKKKSKSKIKEKVVEEPKLIKKVSKKEEVKSKAKPKK